MHQASQGLLNIKAGPRFLDQACPSPCSCLPLTKLSPSVTQVYNATAREVLFGHYLNMAQERRVVLGYDKPGFLAK